MKIFSLGSSSKGNSTYLETEEGAILIDAGFGVRKTEELLKIPGFSLSKISAIFLTHEHSDHVAGLLSLTKKLNGVLVYGSSQTLSNVVASGRVSSFSKFVEIGFNSVVKVESFEVSAFNVQHDSESCFGFCVKYGNKKFSICTDLGCITPNVLKNLKGSDFVLIESNFDVRMLKTSKYPLALKKRIVSNRGHLSNYDAAKLIYWLICNGVRRFLLGHLSEKNNRPKLAFETVVSALRKFNFKNNYDYFLDVAPARSEGAVFEV